jgi:hypothetical protein
MGAILATLTALYLVEGVWCFAAISRAVSCRWWDVVPFKSLFTLAWVSMVACAPVQAFSMFDNQFPAPLLLLGEWRLLRREVSCLCAWLFRVERDQRGILRVFGSGSRVGSWCLEVLTRLMVRYYERNDTQNSASRVFAMNTNGLNVMRQLTPPLVWRGLKSSPRQERIVWKGIMLGRSKVAIGMTMRIRRVKNLYKLPYRQSPYYFLWCVASGSDYTVWHNLRIGYWVWSGSGSLFPSG